MRKLYAVVFVLLVFSMNSCNASKQEVVFVRNEKFATIKESTFEDSVKGYDSEIDLESVIVNTKEEFLTYLENVSKSKRKKKTFVVSERFSDVLDNGEFKDFNLVVLGGNSDGEINLNVDQRHISYLFGVINGMMTRTNSVMLIYSNELKDSYENALSFMAGVKRVNLRAFDSLANNRNVLDLSSVEKEKMKSALNDFVRNNNSDMIFYISDDLSEEILNLSNELNKELFTLSDLGNNLLGGVSYDYKNIFKDVLNGGNKDNNYLVNILNKNVSINLDKLPQEIKNICENVLDEMIDGKIKFPENLNELKGIKL